MSIWTSFADLPDPRTGNEQRHNLLDVLTIALTATICGAESCVDFADFARDREALFREFLELPGGMPAMTRRAILGQFPCGFSHPSRVGRQSITAISKTEC